MAVRGMKMASMGTGGGGVSGRRDPEVGGFGKGVVRVVRGGDVGLPMGG
jgi:hypothetical protein